MLSLNKTELQNLRHTIIEEDNNYKKYLFYSESAVDPQIKQILNKAAQNSLNFKQKLVSFCE
jgi:rubrerythrin